MKVKIICAFLLFLTACIVHRQPEYIMPVDLNEQGKKDFIARFDKGKVLYSASCATCHNKEVKGKTVIPDFNPLQLKEYTLRIKNKEHSKNLSFKTLSEEELNAAVFFLMYRKKKTDDKK